MPCMPPLGYMEDEINAMWALIMQDWCHCESIESHLVATIGTQWAAFWLQYEVGLRQGM